MSDAVDKIDWADFDAIFDHAEALWPKTVTLSAKRDADGGRHGFTAYDFDDLIGDPYYEPAGHKQIVRVMLWAMFCALPRDHREGSFSIRQLDRAKARAKFESDIRSARDDGEHTPEEDYYFHYNMEP